MKSYYKICLAIYKKSKEEDLDLRDLIREWIMLFEKTNVSGWNRDKFLEMMMVVKKENETKN